ncbi:MAG: indole-3-glycerol phosphate synthase TrpC [Deltaproteobacteria bacterium]|nr:indole-3-glycerol phosphate synthase TrpC [Deltaproteobacteria bacterium]MBW1967070.1 indole-3-glycerol phosphate synthase TrpC [Deltaproteobacteria bacterium]MBW2097720.1 indole-3-glycerol phosphate synthase TrpC [Deltaproteobacteria bacterium]
MSILNTIIADKKAELKKRRRRGLIPPEHEVAPPRGFRKALASDSGVSIIAEIKKASPSKGLLCPDFDPVSIAKDYQSGGAKAVSVLTDERFFQGKLEFIPEIRNEIDLPILRKDFIIDHFQVEESGLWGADAVLLIVAALDGSMLSELMAHARERGLDPLVEVHDENEMERALAADADFIGVNNRNLEDFSISLEATFRIRKALPSEMPLVSESGISTPDDIKRLLDAGITAALIGEALMKAEDRIKYLSALVNAGRM